MTFKIAAFAVLMLMTIQSSFAQSWDILGNEVQIASASTTGTSMVVLNEGLEQIPYIAYLENSIPRVKKRNTNGTWSQVGGNLDIALSTTYPYLNIYADANGKLFVSYILSDKKVYVKTYNTATSNWEPLNNDANNKMVSSANGVYVASTNFRSTRSYMAFDSSNNIYISYTADGICNVKKYNNTTNAWESFGNTIGSASLYIASQKIIFDEAGTMWVGVVTAAAANSTSGNIKLFKYNAGTSTFDDTASATNPAITVRELDMTLVKGTGQTTSGRIAMAVNNTTDSSSGTRGVVCLYDKVANSWASTNVGYGNKAATYIHIIGDDLGNLYCNWVDQTASVGTSTCAVKKLNAGQTTLWYELKNPATVRGVDEPTNNTNLGIASGSTTPYIIYTKANLVANIATPIVRKYVGPVGTAPGITNFTPSLTTTAPAPSTAFTISGDNFTGATAVTFGGNPVTSFTVTNNNSITGVTSATAVADLTISVTTPSGTATMTGMAPSALSYPTATATYSTLLVPTVTAPSTLVYSITPTLPVGLSINLGTGVIGGSPTVTSGSTTYTITATNPFGSATTTVTFATDMGPTAFSYSPAPSASYTTGSAIATLTPVISLGKGTSATYAVNTPLPTGLTLDVNTGIISGTPTVVTPYTIYIVTATTSYGNVSRVIAFSTDAPLSTNSFEKTDSVIVYPNPTSDLVSVALPNNAVIQKIAVYNSLGQLVLTETNSTFSLQNLDSGIYYLTIFTTEGNYAKKIVKK